ncbi:MAG: helix-turn-helix domain-containing protein, partial [Odoribacter sp.]|nr:helix-turn-helix domain-containing protein [Odoribacter sp.]
MEEKDFFSIDEVAEKLSISIKSVRRMVASGELKSVKIRNLYRISREAYDDFLKSHEVIPSTPNSLSDNDESKESPKKKREHKTRVCIDSENTSDLLGNANKDDVHWADIAAIWQNPSRSKMTFVDLFCGAG